ncbi:MAG: hypothetical protein EXX96DRAFT_613639 [Benjaminiella poitrasii]|nr:MAG: hypothetical protein EXX96DRAFT_613639 [Benjaminiella poitrasii]
MTNDLIDPSDNEKEHENQVLTLKHYSFEIEFNCHRKAIYTRNMEEALKSFILFQTNSANDEKFEAYIIEFADHINPTRNTDLSSFFAYLPAFIQSTIIEKIAELLEKDEPLKAFQALFDYIQFYSRYAYKYLVRAIKLLVLGAQNLKDENKRQHYIHLLVTQVFPCLFQQRILLLNQRASPSLEGKMICMPFHLFEQYLLLGQQYYLERRDWQALFKFTGNMLACCGYARPTNDHLERFYRMRRYRTQLHVKDNEDNDELMARVAIMLEFKSVVVDFIQCSVAYYESVCGCDEKSCLIPICIIHDDDNVAAAASTTALKPDDYEDVIHPTSTSNKRSRYRNEDQWTEGKRRKRDDGEGLDATCMKGVDDTLQILSKAADCLRHLVELWDWAMYKAPDYDWLNDWEEEFIRVLELYQLPFDLTNAILLVRSDLALSTPSVTGSLAKALQLSQTICDRIEDYRRKAREDNNCDKVDIPFMFTFRVLYSIAVIYLLSGSSPQSTLEIAIILSVFPVPNLLDDHDFFVDESDCKTVASVFHDEHEFGLMRVTQAGLVVRCIKHLIVSLNNSEPCSVNRNKSTTNMASIDSALSWDDKAGQMMVLMQYGWSYWSTQTNIWQTILYRIQEKGVFRNRVFLEYIYVPEILQAFQQLLHSSNSEGERRVLLDIIPPEFTIKAAASQHNNQRTTMTTTTAAAAPPPPTGVKLPSLSSMTVNHKESTFVLPQPSAVYPANLTKNTMSPTWYSASTQKSSTVNWMSPSFYYNSHPATAAAANDDKQQKIANEILSQYLISRERRYATTNKITPQRMKYVLQKFLKNHVIYK